MGNCYFFFIVFCFKRLSFVERVGCGVVDVIDCEVGVKG